jgi:glutamate-ammonia-ligase adenylyltransferase
MHPTTPVARLRQYVQQQSRFLSVYVDRHPEALDDLVVRDGLNRGFRSDDFHRRLHEMPQELPPALLFASFRRRQLLRILLRDVLGLASLSETTEELSELAGVIVNAALHRILDSLSARYGMPETGLCVIALGKFGGKELNYSSDIDLLFLYGENGETGGISYKEFFKKAAVQLTELLSTHTPEGFCYRVDLRLRPEGTHGEVCISLEGAKHYYEKRARDWELQMMIKARPVAGDLAVGEALLDFVEPLTYATTLDFSAIETMSETRARLNEKLNARRGSPTKSAGGIDIKLARGGIRDIEFLVQCLQRLHGGRSPWVRHGGTLLALSRLQDKGLISETEYSKLASAYTFLRTLEHRLQFFDDRQTHVLPASPAELEAVALRMPATAGSDAWTAQSLIGELEIHCAGVVDIYDRIIHAQQRTVPSPSPATPVAHAPPSSLQTSLERHAPSFSERVRISREKRRLKSFEHFLETIDSLPEILQLLETDQNLRQTVIDLFESSPFFAEQIARSPSLLFELRDSGPPVELPTDPVELRTYYRRCAMRIQAASIVHAKPVFETLGEMSDLADRVISFAFDLAVAPLELKPFQSRMMVIALGRLGMREFDLDSDADLLFVIPDEASADHLQWTRVAERVIEILASYTSAGAIFSVDTRLRPSGREGGLVQTTATFLDYFDKRAEAWEGIAYMKARAVAGDTEAATHFLGRLQETDWRRWGQSGRSRRDLREMRLKLEREQGKATPLKAGPGGYYDIDFLLLYLRLKSAGVFFKVLNTPERIDVLEKMGHLEREDAEVLARAAGFYRALDHGLRLFSGHAEGKLPGSEVKLDALAQLVTRWLPGDPLHDGAALAARLDSVKEETRRIFLRFFS